MGVIWGNWGEFRAFGDGFGTSWGRFVTTEALWGGFGAFWGGFGAFWGGFRADLGQLGHYGADLGHFKADLGHFGADLWLCGGPFVPTWWAQGSHVGPEVTCWVRGHTQGRERPHEALWEGPHCVRGVEGGWGVGGWFGDGGFAPELRRCPAAPAPIPGARPGPPGARSGPPEAPQRERGRPPPPPCWWSRGVASLRRDARRTEMTSGGGSGRATRRRLERRPRSSRSEWRMRDQK